MDTENKIYQIQIKIIMNQIHYCNETHPVQFVDVPTPSDTLNQMAVDKMRAGIAHFVFIKKDGGRRESFGTLNSAMIENMAGPRAASDGRATTPNLTAQSYFDLSAGDWRAFVRENLIIVF